MKMLAYYVVACWESYGDECDYVAGPFRWYSQAWDYQREAEKDGGDYKIMSASTEVEEE